jgi:transcription elongation factor Elf1
MTDTKITCPRCSTRKISQIAYDMDGLDAICDHCQENAHIEFMSTTGRLLGLTCDPTCQCQRQSISLSAQLAE